MKIYLVVLGLLLLLKNEVSPLTCFTCENQSSNLRCLRFRECSEEEGFCVTAVASYKFGVMTVKKRITKRCSAFCPDLQMVLGFASFGSSCCQQSWCNIWGSLGERNATQ
ncbi:lymphocyte antigen 6E-like [Thamnophis elegans]|uniref:lymphocyte antigen 6E-like n=1 Tax=Thamnophis elegans TaxID=35005 RepID=UPI00137867EC|nr:lymphocyte antigen 6E-like [Thamnophis elegans]